MGGPFLLLSLDSAVAAVPPAVLGHDCRSRSPSLGFRAGHQVFLACANTRAQNSDEVVQALRTGQMTALQKSSGGIRGIVVGDFVGRFAARTLAQQLSPPV